MYNNHPLKDNLLYRKYSGEKQDEFVYHILAKRLTEPGYFLDFACGHPVDHNNTFLLEKLLGWDGLSIDKTNIEMEYNWKGYRNSKFITGDVYDTNLSSKIQDNLKQTLIDYISIDVDCAGTQLSHLAFRHIFDITNIQFKCLTIEHENFKHGSIVTDLTRPYLIDSGYHLLFKDVSFPDGNSFEDWWINPKYINFSDQLVINYNNLTYDQCINKIKDL